MPTRTTIQDRLMRHANKHSDMRKRSGSVEVTPEVGERQQGKAPVFAFAGLRLARLAPVR